MQADRIELQEDELALVATGNVVFERPGEKVVAERLDANLLTGYVKFFKTRGILGQDFHFVAESFEDVGNGDYVIERGSFTTCAQPSPRWHFAAGRAVLRPRKRVWLTNVQFRIKNIPFLYFPAFYYPLGRSERKTGFLMPGYTNSDVQGHQISQTFFWAISRSMDATFTVDHYTRAGTGLTSQYRYRGRSGSRSDVNFRGRRDTLSESLEYTLRFTVAHQFPGKVRFNATGDTFSSFDFSQRADNTFAGATNRRKRIKANATGTFFRHRIQTRIQDQQTLYPNRTRLRRTWPQVTIKRRNLNLFGRVLQVGYEVDFARIARSRRDDINAWNRVYIGPEIGISLPSTSFLDLHADFEAGFLRYSGSRDLETKDFMPDTPLRRKYYGVSVSMIGPKLERVFETPNNFYAARFKHLIEPEVDWGYRTADDNLKQVERFDGRDSYPQTHEMSFGLANRVLAKRVPRRRRTDLRHRPDHLAGLPELLLQPGGRGLLQRLREFLLRGRGIHHREVPHSVGLPLHPRLRGRRRLAYGVGSGRAGLHPDPRERARQRPDSRSAHQPELVEAGPAPRRYGYRTGEGGRHELHAPRRRLCAGGDPPSRRQHELRHCRAAAVQHSGPRRYPVSVLRREFQLEPVQPAQPEREHLHVRNHARRDHQLRLRDRRSGHFLTGRALRRRRPARSGEQTFRECSSS